MENMDNNSGNMGLPIPPKSAPDKSIENDKKCCHHMFGCHNGHCQGKHCRFFHPLLILLAAIIIFLIGVSFGAHCNREREYRGYHNQRQGMMGQIFNGRLMNRSANIQGIAQANSTGNVSPMMWRVYSQANGQATVNLAQLVGTITKIEGNKITVSNNSGQAITVNVASTTAVTGIAGPLSLNALKVGQNIIVIGSSDANQQFNAQAVNVQ